MRNWIVRVASLYVFTVVVLLVIGMLLPSVNVGWHALWGGVILTLAALAIRPVLRSAFRKSAEKSSAKRSRLGEKLLQYALVFLVELILWVLTVWLSGVRVRGWSILGYLLPPLILMFAWMIYDAIAERMEKTAGGLYDKAEARITGGEHRGTPAADSPAAATGRAELADGLTPEQRRMLDELG